MFKNSERCWATSLAWCGPIWCSSSDLDDFVASWFGLSVEEASRLFSEERRRDASATLTLNRYQRKETERFKCFAYDDLVKRDKVNLDIFWLKDESLEDSANLPSPDMIAAEIVEELEAALAQFAEIATDLKADGVERGEVEDG
jgi:type I restriction enzyme M protein